MRKKFAIEFKRYTILQLDYSNAFELSQCKCLPACVRVCVFVWECVISVQHLLTPLMYNCWFGKMHMCVCVCVWGFTVSFEGCAKNILFRWLVDWLDGWYVGCLWSFVLLAFVVYPLLHQCLDALPVWSRRVGDPCWFHIASHYVMH